ncbi:MAG: CBS domain-containing protein [Burkholderiaceae bacterium]|nr:CBS domain-containing protein [Burkholderiaceae bacterium]MDH3459435.1 CBS domain-containing protein [Burkholderiaceae bacterium]
MAAYLREIATGAVMVAEPETTALRAAQLMRQHHVGALVVVPAGLAGSKPLGIVTDRDLVLGVMAEGLDPAVFTVGDVMSTNPITAGEETSLADAIALLAQHRLRRLIVVNEAGLVVGLATLEDLMEAMAAEFTTLATALRGARDREIKERV